ncbi:MAG: hypothetical protein HUJ53_03670 [Holdemanella sp.]|nr:hypothetical protein [Holdemanella sp.]
MSTRRKIKMALKAAKVVGGIGLLTYVGLFIVFFFDLDGKLLYHVVEPFLVKHYDAMERKNPLESPYKDVPKGQETL